MKVKGLKFFDWKVASRLIAEHKPVEAMAGLMEFWNITAFTIWADGKPIKNKYQLSTVLGGTPILRLVFADRYDDIECWCIDVPAEWIASVRQVNWPEDAATD